MALTRERTASASLPAPEDPVDPTARRTRRPGPWLLAVAAAYVTTMLVVVVPRVALGWDEALYASQVSPRVPAGFFSAPRARGVTYLIAPVVHVTASTVALRMYLAVLAGVLLVAGFWPWLRVFRRPATVPLAALVFGSLWVVLFYGPSAMPNTWVALGALAAVGWFVRYGYGASRWSLAGVGAGLAFVALVRPSDAFWLVVPLAVAMLVSRRWRRLPLYGAALAGAALGLTPWLVESYQRFGGPVARLHRASQIEGGLAWHPVGVYYQLRSLDGPLLCRPCTGHLASPVLTLWWLAIPVLVALGLVVAARTRELAATAVPAACGASIGLSYLLTLTYAAPRFLVPAYALLSLPVGVLLGRLVGGARRFRSPVTVAVALVLALQVASQVAVLVHESGDHTTAALGYQPAAAALKRDGVRTPCIITGTDDVPIGYVLGCREEEWRGHNQNTTKAGLLATARHEDAVYVSHRAKPPGFLRGWRRHPLPTPRGEHRWFAFTPPWEPIR
ncbi:MAG: hypothetical protein J2P24_04665 [Streptosporangiales bacterium]|nr:hypothetical protein [Streptosporangiales bacterium]MBO0891942.1 hypothetical protein [Acidothermales bacterium]